jgi:hypothetical protein
MELMQVKSTEGGRIHDGPVHVAYSDYRAILGPIGDPVRRPPIEILGSNADRDAKRKREERESRKRTREHAEEAYPLPRHARRPKSHSSG